MVRERKVETMHCGGENTLKHFGGIFGSGEIPPKKKKKKEKVLVNFEPPQQQQQKIFSAANAVSSTTGFDQMLAYFNNVKVLVFKSVLNQIFHLKQE